MEFQEKYLRIWSPLICVDQDEGCNISTRLPGAFAFGGDGGGQILVSLVGPKGAGIYRVGYGDLDPEDVVWLSDSLEALLEEGDGFSRL